MRTLEETARLLGIIAGIDRREVDDLLVRAWFETLEDVDFDEARYAVLKHYSKETRYIMPADVRSILAMGRPHPSVRVGALAGIEAARLNAVDPEKTREYAAQARRVLAEISSRTTVA